MWSKFTYVSNYVFEMNAIWNPYFFFLLKYMLGLLLILISKSWGCPPHPLGVEHAFLRQRHMRRGGGGVIYFCQGFFSCMMPSIDGWQDGCMDGWVTWWKKFHEKQPRRPLLYVIPLWNRAIFATLKALGRGLQMFFHLQKQRNNLSEFDFLWILKCLLTGLSTKVHMKIKLKASITDPSPT